MTAVRCQFPDPGSSTRPLASSTLGIPWDAIPAGLTARTAGDAWIASGASALLLVPSVIVLDEYNVLINPQHSAAAAIIATTLKRWIYDPRFFP